MRSLRTGLTALAVASLAALAHADDAASTAGAGEGASAPQGTVLIPNGFADFQQLLGGLMQNQHSLIVQKHGEGSPQADISLAAVDNQNYLTKALLDFQNNPPAAWWVFYNAVGNFTALLNNTNYLLSPRLGANTFISRPVWYRNQPKVATNQKAFANINPTLISLAPCFFRLNAAGIQIDPQLITISPRLAQFDPLGMNIEPKLITTQPTLLSIQPYGLSAGPINVKASPVFLDVSPNVKVVPGSPKAPTFSPGVALKPIPEPAIITNEIGVSKPVDAAALKRSNAAAIVVQG